MLKKFFIAIITLWFSMYGLGFGAINVTSPSSNETIEAAEDYATAAFQDPWDMSQRTDLGWFIWDKLSGSKSNLTGQTFSNGIFSASSTTNDPNIYILDSGVTGTCYLGKIGKNYPINASKYKVFAIRMNLNKNHDALLYWSKNTIYTDISRSGPFSVRSGWNIYIVKISSLGSFKVLGTKTSWSGNKGALRFDPAPVKVNMNIDWIRLVEDDAGLYRTVRWTGNSGNVDIYLDTDKNSGNGTLGKVASNKSGASYSLYVGALSPGKYYVGVKNTSGGSIVYGAGYYQVNEIPTFEFTSPSPEGGADFASTVMGNPWNFNATSDLDLYYRISSLSTPVVSVEDINGSAFNAQVLKATSQATNKNAGDPVLYPMIWWNKGRGLTYPIDTSLYRILVLKMGLPGNFDLNRGSIARIVWKRKGDGDKENVSADVIIRHKSGGKVVVPTVIADMKGLLLEDPPHSPSRAGWTGQVEGFRLDPHEFNTATTFYVDNIKLAAFERADDSYTIRWNSSGARASASSGDTSGPNAAAGVWLYYDTNRSGFNGTKIVGGVSASAGSYTWNTSNMAEGAYYIHSVISNGLNTNMVYARWPIVIDHSGGGTSSPTISLNKTSLSFTASGNKTFTVSNSGGGTLNWTASDNASWISVSPSSGANSGTVTVTVNASGKSAGTYSGKVTITDSNATNSPKTVNVTLTVSGGGGSGTPKISLSRIRMWFGGAGSSLTSPQYCIVGNSASGTLNWSASSNKSWLKISPTSGVNTGQLKVSVSKSGLGLGTYEGRITISDPNASNSPKYINATLKVYASGKTSKPFGQFATPTNGATYRSSIPVTGWVLDDIEVSSVKIYNGSDYVGDAVFVEGSRPDVYNAYPTQPLGYRAGWGYMMLTNFLPGGGNGRYTFYARATDKEGNVVTLGSKTITIDNKNAVKPFGAIDTPAQGGTASGAKFINWGWALTPQPKKIPTNGSTIDVVVDGVKIAKPNYNNYRSDIANLFPSYANSQGAIGYYYLDTTAYDNGVHTIQWIAKDNQGQGDGIGSRYFNITNTAGNRTSQSSTQSGTNPIPPPGSKYLVNGSRLKATGLNFNTHALREQEFPTDRTGPVFFRKGYDEYSEFQPAYPTEDGTIVIEIAQSERLELHFFSEKPHLTDPTGLPIDTPYYQPRTLNQSELPIGSTLDITQGAFYWQPGAAFLGDYPLDFLTTGQNEWWRKKIIIRIIPK
jgi:hypothetical protein